MTYSLNDDSAVLVSFVGWVEERNPTTPLIMPDNRHSSSGVRISWYKIQGGTGNKRSVPVIPRSRILYIED
jgi:hypothetical protein